MAGTIGIKVANGDFYPIVGENSTAKKRLVLTTVHDNQGSVQIDLFRSISISMLDAQYIGSLVVEDIRQCRKGDPSIEMLISADAEGNITAEAYDLDASPDSDHHILNVSLRTMDTLTRPEDYPDFDMETEEPEAAPAAFGREKERGRKFPWLLVAVLLIVIGLAAVWLFFPRGTDGVAATAETAPAYTERVEPLPPPEPLPPMPERIPVPVTPEPPVLQVHPAQPETVAMPIAPAAQPVEISPPIIRAPAAPPEPPQQDIERERPPAPVLSYRVPAVIPPNGVEYRIRWGDTLWDIAAAFYRDPFQYPRIARHNGIRDPNFILAGFIVRIPPLN